MFTETNSLTILWDKCLEKQRWLQPFISLSSRINLCHRSLFSFALLWKLWYLCLIILNRSKLWTFSYGLKITATLLPDVKPVIVCHLKLWYGRVKFTWWIVMESLLYLAVSFFGIECKQLFCRLYYYPKESNGNCFSILMILGSTKIVTRCKCFVSNSFFLSKQEICY